MGWAKYCEDNMSIYIGRMIMKESVLNVCAYENEKSRDENKIKKCNESRKESNLFSVSQKSFDEQNGRRGLEIVFQNGIEENMMRKLQMNGWWWSKANACWCNLDTRGNRKYAESLICKGAKGRIIQRAC